jgi:hypothetical protein
MRLCLCGQQQDECGYSGVTGRYGSAGYGRLRPETTGYGRHFLDSRTGCDQLRPARTRHSLCERCVGALVPVSTTVTFSRALTTFDVKGPEPSQLPTTFTARAATSRTVPAETTDARAMVAFARSESGIASVGLKAIEFVRERYR